MSSATSTCQYVDEDGPAVMTVTYHGASDVLSIDDGKGQSMAVGYEAARALVHALGVVSRARAELDVAGHD